MATADSLPFLHGSGGSCVPPPILVRSETNLLVSETFLVSETNLEILVRSTFPKLKFKVYYFDPEIVRSLILMSVRQAFEQPLNYARNYLADLLEPCV
ncbi:Probable galacturonosyltransferase-like 7 [Linum perenne]